MFLYNFLFIHLFLSVDYTCNDFVLLIHLQLLKDAFQFYKNFMDKIKWKRG